MRREGEEEEKEMDEEKEKEEEIQRRSSAPSQDPPCQARAQVTRERLERDGVHHAVEAGGRDDDKAVRRQGGHRARMPGNTPHALPVHS